MVASKKIAAGTRSHGREKMADGRIGGTIGAHLARAGHDITFVDRSPEHVAAMNAAGLRIEGPLAQFGVRAPAFTPDALDGEFAHVVLAVRNLIYLGIVAWLGSRLLRAEAQP